MCQDYIHATKGMQPNQLLIPFGFDTVDPCFMTSLKLRPLLNNIKLTFLMSSGLRH